MLRLNPYRIGWRTIKTAVGMALGVIIAKLMGLDNYASSAILVVLCIKDTKMNSVKAIWSRLVSCMIAMGFGATIFPLLGQHAWVLGLIVLFFIPLTVMFNTQEGVVTSIVILLHFFNATTIDINLVLNEMMLLLIGLSIAFIMNTFMPSFEKELTSYQNDIEAQIRHIFYAYSTMCSKDTPTCDLSFDQLLLTIRKAKSVAFRDVKNHFVRNENSFYHYFDMRQDQVDILQRIHFNLNHMTVDDVLLPKVAQLFKEMADNVNENNYTAMRLHMLYDIRLQIDDLPLPDSHDALHTRASIIQILYDTEAYLNIKSNFGSLKLYHEVN
ncbi:aromatic acid exporter family protein [Staphylococcus muscae]|uniref:Membrane protein n=1 Tax=Staphylococcus muscae TaxID=1294 RepID=A0A240C3L5_9STAP|nr:aromatic acid exporter family protein [Staphylococcus muscae]AVQ33115.1 aromatic acid exporter family protein [Staphylococcus muscae]PNZ04746.1 aromatic acid exporter family protein [Staphylococcus muscae]GGA88262.1 membrane protein [Staphylococcus muscae]SNW02564.1 membrane protein [Staphylococcus muscae]